MTQSVYVVSAVRTPIGSFQGALSSVSAPRLGAVVITKALERAKLRPEDVQEVFMGNVVGAGIGQAPARQAAIFANLPASVPCTTINKVCGSGMQAVIFGTKTLRLGDADIVVAGGIESMSRIPYYLPAARDGMRMGDGKVVDGMIFDGLWDPYGNQHMGMFGEKCAKEFGFTREAQDAFAVESYRRALEAQKQGKFDAEIVGVEVPQRKGEPVVVQVDEEPARGNPSKMAQLRPAFAKDGTITAANASKIDDGACAMVLATDEAVKKHGLVPLARVVGYAGVAQDPAWFTTAPAAAIDKTLTTLGLKTQDIDLFEINEAFAVVTMHSIQACKLDPEIVNVHGGAVSLGHPIGCSGARITTTLLHAMLDRKVKRGLATLCIGGGEALAVVLETI
ncbi:MAG TPA: thiolase family protein [Polyangiaceae bacterium]|jgi:acetyl-CoA C-acetyltransferase|nr:MAG: Acetyl-CoA acetyltransferase [Deltaproteobacteria bacterium ADurb.Bin207]HNS97773.1 thiolase family protein [Polyangiaceae bacterium]HNZ25224.1 thiolase family protein [Polyangiaceae bacterium]HOD25105.1 thiolase family protein [Polyangiaceae bacterium]HOE51829.1 thiolase family protein [Polyangiaceae bacterium]